MTRPRCVQTGTKKRNPLRRDFVVDANYGIPVNEAVTLWRGLEAYQAEHVADVRSAELVQAERNSGSGLELTLAIETKQREHIRKLLKDHPEGIRLVVEYSTSEPG
jgi:hypothetical protein